MRISDWSSDVCSSGVGRATLADGSPLPRIPPLSLLGALEGQFGHFDARAEVQWFDKQERTAALETPTDGFTSVNLSLAWHPVEGSDNLTVIAGVDNVFDVEGRRHSSLTKESVTHAGRQTKMNVRSCFCSSSRTGRHNTPLYGNGSLDRKN